MLINTRKLRTGRTGPRFDKAVACAVLPAVLDQTQRVETERLAEKSVQLFRSIDDESWAFFVTLFLTTYLQIITEDRWFSDEVRKIT